MRKFRQALRFLQDFAREFCSGRKQGMKKDRRKGGPFFPVPIQRQRFRLDGFPALFCNFRRDMHRAAAGGL